MILENLVNLKGDGSFEINKNYFTYPYDHIMINEKFEKLFGLQRRVSESILEQYHFDMAASIQDVTEKIVISICNHLHDITKLDSICLSGGVALNCVANGKIIESTPFKDVWIQPAAGDAGGALGSALFVWHEILNQPKVLPSDGSKDSMKGAYLGPSFSNNEIISALNKFSLQFEVVENENDLFKSISDVLEDEKIIGLFQGRMEFGPRALGARSIIGDPRSPMMQKNMNLKIKFRESFRPFAPAIMRESVNEWFDLYYKDDSKLGDQNGYDSPYMLLVSPVKESIRFNIDKANDKLFGLDKLNHIRSKISSCTHVDFSARIQTVTENTNPFFYKILHEFNRNTNCPVLINTSFNVRGEPIVCSPEDAIKCFLGTGIDTLVLNNVLVHKANQLNLEKSEYHELFELD
jgi:carbamoyltransferase